MRVLVTWGSKRDAREPLPTAIGWTSIVIALDAVVVAGLVQRSFAMFTSVAGSWLPFVLIFASVYGTGYIVFMQPESRLSTEKISR